MMNITIQDLEHDAAGFLSRVEAGETLIVTRDGHPIAEIRPIQPHIERPRPADSPRKEPESLDEALVDSILREFDGD